MRFIRMICRGRINLFAALMSLVSLAAIAPFSAAVAADRIGIRAGMSGAEVAKALEGRCQDFFIGAPFVTCQNGNVTLTATVSKKDRLYYARFTEPSTEPQDTYAATLAAELGYQSKQTICDALNWLKVDFCWVDPTGSTYLYAGIPEEDGKFTSYLMNSIIESQDGEE